MVRILYNRNLNDKPRIFKFFTLWEFTFLLFVLVSPVVFANFLNLPPSFVDSLILLAIFSIFILRFKLGRPEGYFPHWVKKFFRARHLRPGHYAPIPPIDLPAATIPTRADLAQTEMQLFKQFDLVYISRGKALPKAMFDQDFLDAYEAMLESGEPFSMN